VKLRKDFKIREKYSLQLAFDFFNIFNAVVFSPPALNIDSATFGELTAQANAPRKAQASARFYF
jgi:hypothetical protein